MAAKCRSRDTLRKSVRKRHTLSRCATRLRTQGEKAKENAIEKARDVGLIYFETFLDISRPSVVACTASSNLPGNHASTRSRSRSPMNHARIENTASAMTDLCGCRVAKLFDDIFFLIRSREIKGSRFDIDIEWYHRVSRCLENRI